MTNTTAAAAEAAPKSLLARFFGIITSPQATFGMMALICIGMALMVGGYLFTKTGQQAWLDAATGGSFGGPASDQQYAAMAKFAPYVGWFGVAQMLVFAPIIYLVTAGILFAVFNAVRGTLSSSSNLAVLLPMVEETSFLGRLLGMVDLFIIWWLLVLAIGLGVLFRRRTQPIAISLMAVYAVIAVVVAIVRSRMGGA